jgi:hypothetical protein
MSEPVDILSNPDNLSGKTGIVILEVEYLMECDKDKTDEILQTLNETNILVFVAGKTARVVSNVLCQSLPFIPFVFLFTNTWSPSVKSILDTLFPLLDSVHHTLPISVYMEHVDEYTEIGKSIYYHDPSSLFGDLLG